MELKFRAWDSLKKVMIAEDFHVIGEVTMFSVIDQYIQENREGKASLDRYGDIIIMQFTSFKDDSGKDVYDGDITDDGRLVQWHKGSFWLNQIKGDGKFPLHFLRSNRLDRMIIGNKHSNPELIQSL